MPIQTLGDLAEAFEAGRWHMQRFQKNAGTAHALQWADPTFASGQPAYDAHVGTAMAFAPCVAQKNDAIYMPGVASGQHRHLTSATFWSNQGTFNGPGSIVIFDLLGYYPLIDGDSTDLQAADNTITLPRYETGEGVGLVMVNHVAPAIAGGVAVINYTDSQGAEQTATVGVPNSGQNLVCSGARSTVDADVGPVTLPLASGTTGVRRVNSIQYTAPPGGLHCLYLIKPLATCLTGDSLVAVEKEFFSKNGCHCPRIHDGAWLGWFDRIGAGTARSVSWFGNFTFAWG